MPKRIYRKLVRDKIPQIMREDGVRPMVRILPVRQFRKALLAKLAEEAEEALETRNEQSLARELADIEEVLRAIRIEFRLSSQRIEAERKRKLRARGGFRKRFFLESAHE